MRKLSILSASLILISSTAVMSQTRPIGGSVKDEKGAPVKGASINVKGLQVGTQSDSLGQFSINITAGGSLIFTAVGYLPDTLTVEGVSRLSVVLKSDIQSLANVTVKSSVPDNAQHAGDAARAQSIGGALQSYSNSQTNSGAVTASGGGKVAAPTFTATPVTTFTGRTNSFTGISTVNNRYTGASLPVFSHKEETRGMRYLFDHWVKGVVIDTAGNLIDNRNYSLNYDKISQGLLLTEDQNSVIEVNKDQIKSFVLRDDGGREYPFAVIPGINNGNFVEVLVKGNKYLLLKAMKTKFVKSNYHSDGMTESGNPYDEYVEESQFYICQPGFKEIKGIEIKKKALKEALGAEAGKVNSYFSDHPDSKMDEDFITGLVEFINQ